MIFFFERSGKELRVTTRFDNAANGYILEIEWPDRPVQIERYADHEAFERRVQHLQIELTAAEWEQAGSPSLVPDGWRGPSTRLD